MIVPQLRGLVTAQGVAVSEATHPRNVMVATINVVPRLMYSLY